MKQIEKKDQHDRNETEKKTHSKQRLTKYYGAHKYNLVIWTMGII